MARGNIPLRAVLAGTDGSATSTNGQSGEPWRTIAGCGSSSASKRVDPPGQPPPRTVVENDRGHQQQRHPDQASENGRYEERGSNGVTGRVIDILRGRDPNRYPTTGTQGGVNRAAYDNGFRDGLEKGREDVRDNDSFDPVRHSRYRSADRGYNSSYGTKEQYKLVYRDGFEAGYAQGYGRRVR